MNRQKEAEFLRDAILSDDTTQTIVEIVSKLPRDFRLIFLGQAMAITTARGVGISPPPLPAPPPATPAAMQAVI